MTFTNADTANHFSNASRQIKLSTSLKNYMRAYAAIILAHAPWLRTIISGQPWRPTVKTSSKSAYHAKSMATLSTRNKSKFTLYYPRGPSQSGEWTSLAPSWWQTPALAKCKKKSGPQLLRGPKLLSFGLTLFKYYIRILFWALYFGPNKIVFLWAMYWALEEIGL